MGASVGCPSHVHGAPRWFALSQGGAFREDETPASDQIAGVVLPCSAVTTQSDRGLNACLCVAEYGNTVGPRRGMGVIRGLLSRRGFDWSDWLVLNTVCAVVVLVLLLVAAHLVPYAVLVRDWGVSGWFVAGVVLCLADLSAGLWLLKRGVRRG